MHAYQDAIRKVVRPGDTVLDLGSGSAVLGMFACQAGAARVFAVERDEIIFVARELARANGFADRIVFLRSDIKSIRLSERVDLIVSELISKSVLGQKMAEAISWSRDHFLKSGGRILPEEVELLVAPVESAAIYGTVLLPPETEYGISFSPIEQRSVNLPLPARIPAASLLARGQKAYAYQALSAPKTDRFEADLTFEAERTGTLHGFGAWFSSLLADGIRLSNEPPGTPCWDNLFFPLAKPVAVRAGMKIEFNFRARDDSNAPELWHWNVSVRDGDRALAESRQSSFFGKILSPEILQESANNHQPALSGRGRAAQFILNQIGTGLTTEEIALQASEQFRSEFGSTEAALSEVRKMVHQFGGKTPIAIPRTK